MKRVLFLAHGVGNHSNEPGKEWWKGEVEKIKEVAGSLTDDAESGFEAGQLQEAVDNTVFVGLTYDDLLSEFVKTLFEQDEDLKEALRLVGFDELANFFDQAADKQFLRDYLFDILIYRGMREHRGHIRRHLLDQIYPTLQQEGTRKVEYSVMAHSLGTVVMHDTVHLMSIDEGSVYRLGSPFYFSNIFMVANTSALLRNEYDPRESSVRPYVGRNDPGYVDFYFDFAHKLDPVAQFYSFDGYVQGRMKKQYKHVEVDHFQQLNIHGYTHYLSDPRVYLNIFWGLYGDEVVPSAYLAKNTQDGGGAGIAQALQPKRSELEKALKKGTEKVEKAAAEKRRSLALIQIADFLRSVEVSRQ